MKANYKRNYTGLWNSLRLHVLIQNNSMKCLQRLDVIRLRFRACNSWKSSITTDKEWWFFSFFFLESLKEKKNPGLLNWQLQPWVYSSPFTDYLLQPGEKIHYLYSVFPNFWNWNQCLWNPTVLHYINDMTKEALLKFNDDRQLALTEQPVTLV